MNAGTIVGYVTRRDGSPISGAEIWISSAGEFGSAAETKPAAKTDWRGYFQIAFTDCGMNIAEVIEIGGQSNVPVGADTSGRTDSIAAENRFEVTGYLIRKTLKPAV